MTKIIFVQRIFRALLTISERDPALFEIQEQDGNVHIRGPAACRSYAGLHWISSFSRDLYSGYFETARPDRVAGDDRRRNAPVLH